MIAIEPAHKSVIGIYISEERNMFVQSISLDILLINMVSIQFTKMVVYRYSQAWTFFAFETWVAFSFGGVVFKEVMQYFKDRTENCNLQHVYNLIKLFVYLYNANQNFDYFKIGGEIILN